MTSKRSVVQQSATSRLQQSLFQNTGGIFISGDPGTGKSVLGRELLLNAVRSEDTCVILLDPAGDLAEDAWLDICDSNQRTRDRAAYFFPGDTSRPIGAINPLRVAAPDEFGSYRYDAQLECRVLHAAHLLLAAFDDENFDGAPLMYLWTTTILRSLAKMKMPLADAMTFFDVGSELYALLTEVIPDEMARIEFRRLALQKVERQEELLGSTKRRFSALLSQPVVRAHLGAVNETLDFRQMIQDRAILYWNLSRGEDVLSEEAQSILSNLILAEVFHTVFTTPRSQRVPVLVMCDELPVFRSSSSLITTSLRLTRKNLLRLVGLAQGATSFPRSVDDPLLATMTSCASKVFFRHTHPVDCDFFGRVVSLPTRDVERVKYEHREEQQYLARHDIWTLVNRSIQNAYGDSEAEGGSGGTEESESQGSNWSHDTSQQNSVTAGTNETNTKGSSTHKSEQLSQVENAFQTAADRAVKAEGSGAGEHASQASGSSLQHGQTSGESNGTGGNNSVSSSRKNNWSFSRTRQRNSTSGMSFTQQIVPVYLWREVVRVELMTLDEQDQEKASQISRLATGEAFFCPAGQPVVAARVIMTRNLLRETPQFAVRALEQAEGELASLPWYRTVDSILSERAHAQKNFLDELRRCAIQQRISEQAELGSTRPADPTIDRGLADDGITI